MNNAFIEKCPICNSYKINPVFMKKWAESSFYKCKNCFLIFQNPQESQEITLSRYGSSYFNYEFTNEANFFSLIKKTLDDFNILKILPNNSEILEIGSATGLFLKYMKENGHNPVGLEVCKESVIYGRDKYNVNLINSRLEDVNFKENSFDFIHFSHLIEHLNDPIKFLNIIYKVLKPGGLVLATTPNSNGLFSNLYKEEWRCIVSDHLFLFGLKSLKMLFLKKGFKISAFLTWGSIPKGKSINFIKSLADVFVKKFNIGDVTAFLLTK